MREVISRICLLVLLIAGVVLMPQVHVLGAADTACVDQSVEAAAETNADDCCAAKGAADEHLPANAQDDQTPNPGEPCDGPCNGTCDCSCCIQIVRPAPIYVGALASIVSDDALSTALLPTNRRPGQVALSVSIQPPIM